MAAQLLAEHGPGAAQRAILSAETLLAAGQFYIDQWSNWRRIEKTIGEILAENGELIDANQSATYSAGSPRPLIGNNAE